MDKKEIYLAGGCFWGMQAYFDKIKGILETEVGYINGETKLTSYEDVCNDSGHAEAVKLTYDANVLSTKDIFKLFMRVIDPFSSNKQGGDKGIQYRTGIYSNDEPLLIDYAKTLSAWEKLNGVSFLEVTDIKNYCKAELNHQKYLEKNPKGYCHINLSIIPEEYKK